MEAETAGSRGRARGEGGGDETAGIGHYLIGPEDVVGDGWLAGWLSASWTARVRGRPGGGEGLREGETRPFRRWQPAWPSWSVGRARARSLGRVGAAWTRWGGGRRERPGRGWTVRRDCPFRGGGVGQQRKVPGRQMWAEWEDNKRRDTRSNSPADTVQQKGSRRRSRARRERGRMAGGRVGNGSGAGTVACWDGECDGGPKLRPYAFCDFPRCGRAAATRSTLSALRCGPMAAHQPLAARPRVGRARGRGVAPEPSLPPSSLLSSPAPFSRARHACSAAPCRVQDARRQGPMIYGLECARTQRRGRRCRRSRSASLSAESSVFWPPSRPLCSVRLGR